MPLRSAFDEVPPCSRHEQPLHDRVQTPPERDRLPLVVRPAVAQECMELVDWIQRPVTLQRLRRTPRPLRAPLRIRMHRELDASAASVLFVRLEVLGLAIACNDE